jgi:hypothetical protein
MTITRVNDLSDVTGDHLGCWIDGSHMKATEFDIQLVETAIHFGMDINIEDWKELKNQSDDYENESAIEDIFFVSEVAYHWFNELLPRGYYFHIEEQSLYLEHEDMELLND